MNTLNDYVWENRSEEGLDLTIDGYSRGYEEHEITHYSEVRKPLSTIETEDQN